MRGLELGCGGAEPAIELGAHRPEFGLQLLDPRLRARGPMALDQEVPARQAQLLPEDIDLTAPSPAQLLRGLAPLVLPVEFVSGGLDLVSGGFQVPPDGLQFASGGVQLEPQACRVRHRTVEVSPSGVSVGPEVSSLGPQRTEFLGLFGALRLQDLGPGAQPEHHSFGRPGLLRGPCVAIGQDQTHALGRIAEQASLELGYLHESLPFGPSGVATRFCRPR